jgi:biotin operon repressor
MKRALLVSVQAIFLVLGYGAGAEPDWSAVDKVFGTTGKSLPGGVYRVGWPRTDMNVTIGGVKVEAGLALGAWAGFLRTGTGEEVMTMGDFVLLDPEVNPVISALEANGLEVTAIHNHLLNETPHVAYLHFSGHGDAVTLAKGLKAALEKTKTPMAASGAKAEPSAADQAIFKKLQEALGHTGTMAGRILQVSVPRAEKIEEHGMEVPASMSMANPMNFQVVGDRVATTGDFVLIASEVNPVIRELRAHGVDVTALHSHMLEESPRLFFMHFWCVDTPEKVGGALKAALSRVHTKQ